MLLHNINKFRINIAAQFTKASFQQNCISYDLHNYFSK